jgi:hypothetical protein
MPDYLNNKFLLHSIDFSVVLTCDLNLHHRLSWHTHRVSEGIAGDNFLSIKLLVEHIADNFRNLSLHAVPLLL